MQPLTQFLKGMVKAVIGMYKPITKDKELRGRINALCISGLVYYLFYAAYAVFFFSLSISYLGTGANGITGAYVFLLNAFAVLPWAVSIVPILRIILYLLKRRFIPREVVWLLPASILARFAGEIIQNLSFMRPIGLYGARFDILVELFRLISQIIPVIIGVWIVLNYRRFSKNINSKVNEAPHISRAVTKVLESEEFLTALRSTLPKGEADEEYGLDYIPYMLNDNEMRLKELKKSTRFYFSLTVIFGLIITAVVVYFGYLLVNEEAAGLPKNVAEINRRLERINDSMSVVFSSEIGDFRGSSTLRAPTLSELITASSQYDSKNNDVDQVVEEIREDVSRNLDAGEWNVLAESLQSKLINLENVDVSNSSEKEDLQRYIDVLNEAVKEVETFARTKEYALLTLINVTEDIESIISEVESSIGSEEARTTELIKRLGLSLIVASFLLAMLRYISNIYKDHYQDMRRVQYEAQVIRRFYIALKGSFKAEEGSTPNKIIADFVNGSQAIYKRDEISVKDELGNNLNADLIKDILSILSKKA